MKYIKSVDKKRMIKNFLMSPIVLLLLGSFVVRFSLASFGTLSLDQNTFIAWAERAASLGFGQFYAAWSDYLPGYIYVLALLARIQETNLLDTVVLFKLPAILADLGVGYVIYHVLKSRPKTAILASAAYLLNPAVLANSTFWGQVDVLTSLSTLLAILSFNVWPLSAAILGWGVLVKPQALMMLPVLVALMIYKKWKFTRMVGFGSVFALTIILLFYPFSGSTNLLSFIYSRFEATLGQYPYTSVNAFNFWGLSGFWQKDLPGIVSAKNFGVLALGFVSLIAVFKNKLTTAKPYHALAILLLTNFLFFTSMHERHMLPALAPLAIAAAITPNLWIVYIGLSITYVLNMFYSYKWITDDFAEVLPDIIVKIVIAINLVLFVYLIRQTLVPSSKFLLASIRNFFKSLKREEIDDRINSKWEKRLLFGILLFSLVIRLVRLDFPPQDYFDEIYHAFTARQMLVGDPKPWHWSSAHPEGFAYEWTHPPLAKEIMAASMGVLGVHSFAWRLPGALLGVAIVLMVYKIAKKLFASRDIAIFAALFIALDGLVLTMSRIGTADVYFVAFALISYYYFLAKRDLISAIFLGFAAATKWSTMWMLPVFALSFVLLRPKIKLSLLWYLLIPPVIYLASYLPMFTFGHNLETFWGMQKQMWWYHSGLNATHPYTSAWWSWPLTLRPVYLYQNYKDGIVANIYAHGNPFFFWLGGLSVVLSLFVAIKKRLVVYLVLVFSYLVLFTPWAISPRIMFLYHYLPSVPFMAIILASLLKRIKWLLLPSLVIFLAFVYFYPHWSAIFVPEWWDKSYYWISSWR